MSRRVKKEPQRSLQAGGGITKPLGKIGTPSKGAVVNRGKALPALRRVKCRDDGEELGTPSTPRPPAAPGKPRASEEGEASAKRRRRQPQRLCAGREKATEAARQSMFDGISRDSLQRYMVYYGISKRQDLKKNLVTRVEKHFEGLVCADEVEVVRGFVRRIRRERQMVARGEALKDEGKGKSPRKK